MMSGLTFLNPWILGALAVVPFLWRFLRIIPPAARKLSFPALMLLKDLHTPSQTSAATPLWLAILRLLIVILLILGLAQPIFDPAGQKETLGAKYVILVFDNSWSSAGQWQRQQEIASLALKTAGQNNQTVFLLTTSPLTNTDPLLQGEGALSPREAQALVESLSPLAWGNDFPALQAALSRSPMGDIPANSARIVWIHGGVGDKEEANIASRLQEWGRLEVFLPPDTPPLAILSSSLQPSLSTSSSSSPQPRIHIRATSTPSLFTLSAMDDSGRILGQTEREIAPGDTTSQVDFDLPLEVANRISKLRIEGQKTAASVFLLDDKWQRHAIGIASQPGQSEQPLIDEEYYLKTALSFGQDILQQPLDTLLNGPASTIILTGNSHISPTQSDRMLTWIQQGGVLIQFAGPHLNTKTAAALLPVRLRQGNRTLGGVMSWQEPIALGSFDPEGPFADLSVPGDIVVERQILASATTSLEADIWARLADGTPLVTAQRRGQGWTILFHVTANADWSNLPLSGLFVEMLQKLVALSRYDQNSPPDQPLPAWRSLNGWGDLVAAPNTALPFMPQSFETAAKPIALGPTHPPGYYGNETTRYALNLGPGLESFRPPGPFPEGTVFVDTLEIEAFAFKPFLLALALIFLCLDTIASVFLRIGGVRPVWPRIPWRRLRVGHTQISLITGSFLVGNSLAILASLWVLAAPVLPAYARQIPPLSQGEIPLDRERIESSLTTRLAFVITGDEETDRLSQEGLAGLSRIINRRSAAELAAPLGVNPETDDLSFFPLLYWPLGQNPPFLSRQAAENLNRFMALGGSILFDTGLQDSAGFGDVNPEFHLNALRELANDLRIPPLVPLPGDHVLTRSFYLIDGAPGRQETQTLWVEESTENAQDSVSSIIIGNGNWVGAWALDHQDQPLYAVFPGGEKQREQAYRFGVNLMMYVLTGNYKSDQVHIPAILERLGQ